MTGPLSSKSLQLLHGFSSVVRRLSESRSVSDVLGVCTRRRREEPDVWDDWEEVSTYEWWRNPSGKTIPVTIRVRSRKGRSRRFVLLIVNGRTGLRKPRDLLTEGLSSRIESLVGTYTDCFPLVTRTFTPSHSPSCHRFRVTFV